MATLKSLQGARLDANIDSLDPKDAQKGELGQIMAGDDGRLYRFVQFVDLDVSDGDAVELADIEYDDEGNITTYQVSSQTSGGGNAIDGASEGVAVASVSSSNFGFIQVGGVKQNINTENTTVAVGDYVLPDGTNDGEVSTAGADAKHEAIAVVENDLSSQCSGKLVPRL